MSLKIKVFKRENYKNSKLPLASFSKGKIQVTIWHGRFRNEPLISFTKSYDRKFTLTKDQLIDFNTCMVAAELFLIREGYVTRIDRLEVRTVSKS